MVDGVFVLQYDHGPDECCPFCGEPYGEHVYNDPRIATCPKVAYYGVPNDQRPEKYRTR